MRDRLHKCSGDLDPCRIVRCHPVGRAGARLCGDCAIAIECALFAPDIERCHALIGTDPLGVWVPNTAPELDFWPGQPIGQITSDRPDLALAVRAQL